MEKNLITVSLEQLAEAEPARCSPRPRRDETVDYARRRAGWPHSGDPEFHRPGIHRDRRAGRFENHLEAPRRRAESGFDPEHDVGPGGRRLSFAAPYLRRAYADRESFSLLCTFARGRRMPSAAAQRVRAELSEVDTVEARVERSSHILTELTRNVGNRGGDADRQPGARSDRAAVACPKAAS